MLLLGRGSTEGTVENGEEMLKARQVLEDCRVALEDLEKAEDQQEFRSRWVMVCALLRAVGHILDKVDAKRDGSVREIVDDKWNELKANEEENVIFWKFIVTERNNVLKAYQHNYQEGDVAVATQDQVFRIDWDLFQPLKDGRFAGEDCRDIAGDAIEWWTDYLDEVESRIVVRSQLQLSGYR